jgi:hypothetical protein
MTPDGTDKTALPASIGGEPSHALHGGHRWFLQIREVPGDSYPSEERRKELFVVRGDGDEASTRQLTDDATREPLQARWAVGREGGAVDGVVSWSAKLWGQRDEHQPEPPRAIFSAAVSFDESGSLAGATSTAPLGPPDIVIELTPSHSAHPTDPDQMLVTNLLGAAYDWSPQGDQVVYEKDKGLHILELATSQNTTLTAGGDPRWSPDGHRIAFCRGRKSIHSILPDGSNLKTLMQIQQHEGFRAVLAGGGHPIWSPDSSHLVYWWRETVNYTVSVYRIPVDGGEAVNLTRDADRALPVAWRGGEL